MPNLDRGEVTRLTKGAYYQVPLLVHGDEIVMESRAISIDNARYVDRAFGGGRLFPNEKLGLHEILVEFIENDLELTTFTLVDPHYLETIDGTVNRVHRMCHKERRFWVGCVDQWCE